MKHIITVVFLCIFVAILQTEGRMIAFAVLGILGAAIIASLLDATQNNHKRY